LAVRISSLLRHPSMPAVAAALPLLLLWFDYRNNGRERQAITGMGPPNGPTGARRWPY
tara:strand:+ start:367 stop:540 length:174 start_codon:yes stop_codon:yes gene_type:complete